MINQRDSVFWHKLNAGLRYSLVRGVLSPFVDHVIVNEYPKSGASWMTQMLSDALDKPFPRNRLPMVRSSILHGHFMHDVRSDSLLLFWRDGRDVAVSWYYHFVVGHTLTSKKAIETTREQAGITDPANIQDSFPRALEYFLTAPRHPRFTWASFVDKWSDHSEAVHLKYEDLQQDTTARLIETCANLYGKKLELSEASQIVEKYSFQKQSGRKPGEESKGQYLRKGVSGDWKNHFDQQCADMFHHHAGAQLIKLGYEHDSSWVNTFSKGTL
jgi:hypothetical protein